MLKSIGYGAILHFMSGMSGDESEKYAPPWVMLIAHHYPKDYDRCYKLRAGGTTLPICARCAALYPVCVLLLVLQFTVLKIPPALDPVFLFILPLPAFIEWALRKMDAWKSSNMARSITGILFGAGLSRGFYYYLRNPLHPLAWSQGLYFLICFSVIYIFSRFKK